MSSVLAPRARVGRVTQRLLRSPLAEALASPYSVDHYLELLRPEAAVGTVRGAVERVDRPTDDSVTLTLRPTGTWAGFRAGQHVEVTVEIDGVRHTRSYSPASSAHADDGRIELTVRAHEGGRVSGFLRTGVPIGATIGLSQARGELVLSDERPPAVALISGGSGITPVMSMLRTLLDEDYPGPIGFLHYARGLRHAVYAEELDRIAAERPNVRVLRSHTREAPAAELEGRLCAEHLRDAVPDVDGVVAYACGPGPLVEAVHDLWARGGRSAPLHVEPFSPPAPPVVLDRPDVAGLVRFARSGVEAPGDGRSLLQQAEAAGLRPVHGCRMGICRTCTCTKAEGRVRNLNTGETSDELGERIQICVSAPVGDVTLDL